LKPFQLEFFHKLPKLKWLPIRHWFDLRDAMRLRVKVRDPFDGQSYKFIADSLYAYQRARTLLDKEPDMIGWLQRQLKAGDVFLDIGANVGTFSIYAARHLSDEGHVYACEPHLPTTVQLLQNVVINELESRVSVISIAASGSDEFVPFRYKRWRQGASGSQLGAETGLAMAKQVGTELKCGMRVDTMIEKGVIRAPDLIKIDTDGHEVQILSGMTNLLRSKKPRSLRVEVQEGQLPQQLELMRSCGYDLVDKHIGKKWKRALDRGRGLDQISFDAIFEPM